MSAATSASEPAVPVEPVLDVMDIQGNILLGFNRVLKTPFQTVLCLRLDDGPMAVDRFKTWLRTFRPLVTSSHEILSYSGSPATWRHIAFSYPCLLRLDPDAKRFEDPNVKDAAFVDGMSKRSPELGDPTEPGAGGSPRNWRVGGEDPAKRVDVLIIVVADTAPARDLEVGRIKSTVAPATSGAQVIYEETGSTLGRGVEHFGFRGDGTSQPGIRGRLSAGTASFLTPRRNPLDRQHHGLPGQELLWPGEFVFGYRRQRNAYDSNPPPASAGPEWANNGSFLVFRRLRQDVGAFHDFVHNNATSLHIDPEYLAAKLVGRWPSGAPVLRAPTADNNALAASPCADNHFNFQVGTQTIFGHLQQTPSDCSDVAGGGPASLFAASAGDPRGDVCPFVGHIRKVYPRDDPTPPSRPNGEQIRRTYTETHRLIRRGIPYGPPSRSTLTAPFRDPDDRGLLFLAYQTSFVRQFEWVTGVWANNATSSPQPDPVPLEKLGWDPIIGQNNAPGSNRKRTFPIEFADRNGNPQRATLSTETDWVIPTGGEYLFVPSLSALDRLARPLGA